MTARVTHGRALRHAEGSARGLPNNHPGHCPEQELRCFTARLLAEVKAQAILIEKLRHQ